MRREAKQEREFNLARVEGYHCGSYNQHLVFASDRPQTADENYLLANGTMLPMYGIEWETECWGITSRTVYANLLRDVIFSGFHKDLWKIERDGSLGGDVSAECITQPMTRAYIRNNYRNFKAMWQKAKAFGIDCERTAQCGQHLHISVICFGRSKAVQDEAIRKLIYIVNKHYNLMLPLFNRNPSVRHYCGRMMHYANMDNCKGIDLSCFYNDHNVCVNMGHYPYDVELRIIGGQKDYGCFRNSLECAFHLVDIVKTISWKDCDDITKVFRGCNSYVFDRLSTKVREANRITESQLEAIRPTVKEVEYI